MRYVLRSWVFGIALCCSAFGLPALAFAEELFLEVPRDEIRRVVALGYNMDEGVEAAIEELRRRYPDSPVAGMMETGWLYWLQNYKEIDAEAKERFEKRSEAALKFAKRYLRSNRDSPDARFAVSLIELAQTIYYVDERRWWAAFWKSRGSIRVMRRLVKKYPDYHDAKMPLGMAHCYLSKTPGYLKPLAKLMRFEGDWELGLQYMDEAKCDGFWLQVDAIYYLGKLKLELEGDKEAALAEAERLSERFPQNLKFRVRVAQLRRWMGDYESARRVGGSVLDDARSPEFPALSAWAAVETMWGALGTQRFEEAVALSLRCEELAKRFPVLPQEMRWAAFVRAEALLGLGRKEEAVRLWRAIAGESDHPAKAAAEERLGEEAP